MHRSLPTTALPMLLMGVIACDAGQPRSAIATAKQHSSSFAMIGPYHLPVGGAEGYAGMVERYDVLVRTRAELEASLAGAQAGDVVYVAGDAEIDLTGVWGLAIPAGVTLASARGNGSRGALLFTTEARSASMLTAAGPGVRITGLRLQGPPTPIDGPDCGRRDAAGIEVGERSSIQEVDMDFELDNCELWSWAHAAVKVSKARGTRIHHNHIHHNRRRERTPGCRPYGLGYGVVIDRGQALIEANLFDHNRHDIASTGLPSSRYEARHNLMTGGGTSHHFDMHGCPDRCPDPTDLDNCHVECVDDPWLAGERVDIHHNTFWQADFPAVRIRGIPANGALVEHNRFAHPTAAQAVTQINATGNLLVQDNAVAVPPPPSWHISYSADSYWKYHGPSSSTPTDVIVGDFDGDGSADLLARRGWWWNARWQISRQGRGPWEDWRPTLEDPRKLGFGDFDGDGTTDAFKSDGEHWFVSWSASSQWQHLNTSRVSSEQLAFADFDGDGRTDVFRAGGGKWAISWSGSSPWEVVGSSTVPRSDLRFGDFDGDGSADVMRAGGARWYVSYGARTKWRTLNHMLQSVDDIALCDFDGGGTDALHTADGHWFISRSASEPWELINTSGFELPELVLGDFSGDGQCDVIARH